MRRHLRKNGYFFEGISTGKLGTTGNRVSSVNTYERPEDRADVPGHASDDNGDYMANLFLTQKFGDIPVPAGTFPWIQ